MSIPRNTATASRRLFMVDLVDGNGVAYTGSLSTPTIKIIKPGGTSWASANAVALISLTGGPSGTVAVQLTQAEVDTAGTMRVSVDVGTARHFDDTVEINDEEADLASIQTDTTSIISSLSTLTTAVGTVTTNLGTANTNIANIQTRIPTALDGSGNILASVASLGAGAIVAASFAANAITATAIASNAITAAKIAASAITNTTIADGLITTAKVADGFFTLAKFATGAIDSTVLAANAIGATQLATGAITAAKFAASAITSTVLAANAIGTSQVADGFLATAKFADGALTAVKVASDVNTAIATAILSTTIDGSRTVKGALVRLNALVIGKATGLLGTVATFFRQDGTTKAIEFTQDTTAGTRVAASTAAGD